MLKLYNTLTRSTEAFAPADPNRVTMYVCGPTVYNYAHIGNARPAVIFDILYRLLRKQYASVLYARNITDVDDKINAAAKEAQQVISEFTSFFIDAYQADIRALGILEPDIEPRVTAHIPAIINMIERLIDSGNAYVAEGHVLFHVPSFQDYGSLSRLKQSDLIAGARVDVAPYKKDAADFILWKPSTPDLPGWHSPWSIGRPGWHIECSAMSEQHLGQTIDIHGGGQDLVFPHHENEMAQSTCAHQGVPYCTTWVHNGFVTVEGRKMSKSLGNIILTRDLLAQAPGEAIRLALLGAHYRQPLDWNAATLKQAKRSLDRLYNLLGTLADVEPKKPNNNQIEAALFEDLNTPAALAELHLVAKHLQNTRDTAEQARLKGHLLGGAAALGLLENEPANWFFASVPDSMETQEIQKLIDLRNRARERRDFVEADRIRNQLASKGITLEDDARGTRWVKQSDTQV